MWEARWEAMWEQGRESELGPKGQAYIEEKYGSEYTPIEPPYDEDYDYGDYEFDIEY
jgi:hypothetical protein